MEDSSQWLQLLRSLGSFALVIGLIFVLAWLAKRYFNPQKWGMSIQGIRVVQSLPLGVKKKLMVVEVEGKRLLLGVGNDSITRLCELEGASQEQQERGNDYSSGTESLEVAQRT